MNRRILGFFVCICMLFTSGCQVGNVFQNRSLYVTGDPEKTNMTQNYRIMNGSESGLGSVRFLNVNGKIYTCVTTFAYTQVTDGYYKAGLSTRCSAETLRDLDLQVDFDTIDSGKILKAGRVGFAYTGSTTEYFVSVSENLSSLKYDFYSGDCTYTYTPTGAAATGFVNYSYY